MYLCIAWQIFTDDPSRHAQINHDVDLAFGSIPRARLLPQVAVLRPSIESELTRLRVDLDNVEQAHGSDFGYAMLFHKDRDSYHASDPFDVAAARAVTKADPLP